MDCVQEIGYAGAHDKGAARGIEAADFAAWHWNKYYIDKFLTGEKLIPRKDWAAFVNVPGLEYIDATGDMLKYFFSLVPKEILEDHSLHLRAGRGRVAAHEK